MATITKFEELEVWQLARELTSEIFELFTTSADFSKDYKLKDQINGSSGSGGRGVFFAAMKSDRLKF